MKRSWTGRGAAVLLAAVLQACGGGSDAPTSPSGTPNTASPPVVIAASGRLQVSSVDASTGQALAGVTITVNGQSATTDANGQLTIDTQAGNGLVLQAELSRYSRALSRIDVIGNGTTTHRVLLVPMPMGAETTGNSSAPLIARVSNSPAQVTLPANALVDAQTGAAYLGDVVVRVTPIDPGSLPAAMPGSYLYTSASVSTPSPLESFGAIHVDLRNTQGQRLQLASDQTATIRIPVKTRALALPATIPLYHLDESSGVWKEEGQATLQRDAVNGDYYEGQVSHFTFWNADIPLQTIVVKGCVRDDQGRVPQFGAYVNTSGVDYSGYAGAYTDAEGRFSVPMKRMGRASLTAMLGAHTAHTEGVGPSDTDLTLTQCLVLQPSATMAAIVQQPPTQLALIEGGSVVLAVVAHGTDPMRYQWLRNGQPMSGQTLPRLLISDASLADNGADFTLEITDGRGGVIRSDGTTLTVESRQQQGQQQSQLEMDEAMYSLIAALPRSLDLILSPSDALDEETGAMLAPSQVCRTGGLNQLTLNGQNVTGGQTVAQATPHSLLVDFANCDTGIDVYDGKANAVFQYSGLADGDNFDLQISTTMTGLTMSNIGATVPSENALRGDGTFETRNTLQNRQQASITITPKANATLSRPGLPGRVIVYKSGSLQMNGVADNTPWVNYSFRHLSFTLAGKNYVLDGNISGLATGAPSGVITMHADGKEVGRWTDFSGNEVLGVIDPF